MKRLLLVALLLLNITWTSLAQAEKGEVHVLARKAQPITATLKAGTKWTRERSGDGGWTFAIEAADGREANGNTRNKTSEIVTLERLSEAKVRTVLEKRESDSTSVLNGNEAPKKVRPSPLTGIPFIVEMAKDGSFTTAAEAGTLNAEQAKLAKELAAEFAAHDETLIYGEGPRKPGEKWDRAPKEIAASFMPELEVSAGTASMEFLRIEKLRGTPCAVLRTVFKIDGSWTIDETIPPAKTTFEGEIICHRSLGNLINLEQKLEARMTASAAKEEMKSMTLSGPITATTRFTAEKR